MKYLPTFRGNYVLFHFSHLFIQLYWCLLMFTAYICFFVTSWEYFFLYFSRHLVAYWVGVAAVPTTNKVTTSVVHIFVTIIDRLVNIVTKVYLQFVDHNITIMRRRRFNLHMYFLIYPFSWKCHFEASSLFVFIEDTVFYARRWPAFVVAWWHIFYPHAVEVR